MKGPCNQCGSSDGNHTYPDGHTYCFVCNTRTQGGTANPGPMERSMQHHKTPEGIIDGIADRGLQRAVCSKYGVKVTFSSDGTIASHLYPWYESKTELFGYKTRKAGTKEFFCPPNAPKATLLFGQQTCSGRGKYITITEGEVDCLSVSQMFENKWDVVSVRNGASSAYKELQTQLEFLEGYDHIVLCFDNDAAGREATKACQDLFSPNKVKVVAMLKKDANEYLVDGQQRAFVAAWWDSKTYMPAGIVTIEETWADVLKYRDTPSVQYPWVGLNDYLMGQRKEEIVIWAADTGIGKSQVMREIQHHLLQTTNDRVGCLMLEEGIGRSVVGWMSFVAEAPIHKNLKDIDPEVLRGYWDKVQQGNRLVLLDHRGWQNSLDTLKARIRYMKRSLGCEWIVLDHLHIALSSVQGASGDWSGIDELMTDLRALVHELSIGLHLVSHTSGERNLRGSKGISKLADAVVFLERDKHEEDPKLRDITRVVVDKNRWSGEVGTACYLKYSRETGRMFEVPKPEDTEGEF